MPPPGLYVYLYVNSFLILIYLPWNERVPSERLMLQFNLFLAVFDSSSVTDMLFLHFQGTFDYTTALD